MDTLKLLVVDDEAGIRHGIRRALSKYSFEMPVLERTVGFEVHQAESGEEGLERLNQESFDLVLLDYKMPGMTGLEVLERIPKAPHEMLALMVTAFATIETAVRATKSGAFDFIAKPFKPQDLRAIIERAAEQIRETR